MRTPVFPSGTLSEGHHAQPEAGTIPRIVITCPTPTKNVAVKNTRRDSWTPRSAGGPPPQPIPLPGSAAGAVVSRNIAAHGGVILDPATSPILRLNAHTRLRRPSLVDMFSPRRNAHHEHGVGHILGDLPLAGIAHESKKKRGLKERLKLWFK